MFCYGRPASKELGSESSYTKTDCDLDWSRARGVRNGIVQASAACFTLKPSCIFGGFWRIGRHLGTSSALARFGKSILDPVDGSGRPSFRVCPTMRN